MSLTRKNLMVDDEIIVIKKYACIKIAKNDKLKI